MVHYAEHSKWILGALILLLECQRARVNQRRL